jgi:hypothetical protein
MSPKAVRHYTPMIQATIKDSFRVFDKLDEQDEAWNVYQYMLKLASQAVFKFALGYDAHHFDDPDAPLNELVVLIAQSLSLNKKVASRGAWYASLGAVPFTAANQLRQITGRLWGILNKGEWMFCCWHGVSIVTNVDDRSNRPSTKGGYRRGPASTDCCAGSELCSRLSEASYRRSRK